MNRQEYIEEINRQIRYLKNKEKALLYIQEKKEELVRAVEKAEAALDTVNQPKEVAMNSVMQQAQQILIRNGMNAIKGTEFDFGGKEGIYFDRDFMDALRDPRAIIIEYKPDSNTVNVKIDMDEVAGNLALYAVAVSDARESNNVKGTADPALLSLFWREKYYRVAREFTAIPPPKRHGHLTDKTKKKKKPREYDLEKYRAKYWKTIRDRQSSFTGAKAPWWSILNYGVASPKVRGVMKGEGTPYPMTRATYFVEHSIREIKALFNETYTSSATQLNELRAQRKDALKGLEYLASVEQRLRVMPKDISDRPNEELVVDMIKAQLGSRLQNASLERIQLLASQLLANTAPTRARVGQPGKNVEIRIKDIQRRLNR
jgi:hypothetical protein